MKNTRLVYSTDPKENVKCPKCGEIVKECECPPPVELKGRNFVAILRIEKGGRRGKTVTIIDHLPKVEVFLKELASEAKKKCGVGGTYLMDGKEGVIEIQGDQRENLRKLLTEKGYKVKGS
ncbi:MAG: stress response translation initiation inhibitor YciH [Verrucomicrobia bacterium]|nr:MAG: stress response translation initiation inhibitor YciH [Verrucomicrobiota bacterium]